MRKREDMRKDFARMIKLLQKPRTMRELTENLGVTNRTIYRWLDALEEEGQHIEATRKRPVHYRLAR